MEGRDISRPFYISFIFTLIIVVAQCVRLSGPPSRDLQLWIERNDTIYLKTPAFIVGVFCFLILTYFPLKAFLFHLLKTLLLHQNSYNV
jgi:hypothetical protein